MKQYTSNTMYIEKCKVKGSTPYYITRMNELMQRLWFNFFDSPGIDNKEVYLKDIESAGQTHTIHVIIIRMNKSMWKLQYTIPPACKMVL